MVERKARDLKSFSYSASCFWLGIISLKLGPSAGPQSGSRCTALMLELKLMMCEEMMFFLLKDMHTIQMDLFHEAFNCIGIHIWSFLPWSIGGQVRRIPCFVVVDPATRQAGGGFTLPPYDSHFRTPWFVWEWHGSRGWGSRNFPARNVSFSRNVSPFLGVHVQVLLLMVQKSGKPPGH